MVAVYLLNNLELVGRIELLPGLSIIPESKSYAVNKPSGYITYQISTKGGFQKLPFYLCNNLVTPEEAKIFDLANLSDLAVMKVYEHYGTLVGKDTLKVLFVDFDPLTTGLF